MKITIATPMYGGNCSGPFTIGLLGLIKKLETAGHEVYFSALYNESLINRARNTLTHMFLKRNHDKLVFIDGDESFDPESTMKMILEDVDIVGAAVPLKTINWDRAIDAISKNKDPLKNTAKYNINFKNKDDINRINENPLGLVEVTNIGTGLMVVKREVFEMMMPTTDKYRMGNEVSGVGEAHEYIYNFWSVEVDKEKETLLSEDFYFCKKWTDLGNKIYLAPYVKVTHYGTYEYK